MSALIASILGGINWTTIGAVLAAAAGVLFGVFQKQKAKTATAEATAAKAQADLKVSQKDAVVAEANTAAHKAETQAVKEAAQASKEVSAIKTEDLDTEGATMGILREDK